MDPFDGDLSANSTVTNPVDIHILGTYTITYDVSDSNGDSSTLNRTVQVMPAEFSSATMVIVTQVVYYL